MGAGTCDSQLLLKKHPSYQQFACLMSARQGAGGYNGLMYTKKLFGVSSILSLLFVLPVNAETVADTSEFLAPEAPIGTVSCFDYYSFGSVQADLHTPLQSVVSGTPVTFTGTIRNNNPYPVVDGSLYVKLFHYYTHDKNVYGPDVVDQKVVLSDIVIPAKSSVPVSFSWQVPAYAESGEYALGTYFLTSRKSNLLGLSFTDDVVGNTVPFTIVGEDLSGVGFDKTSVTINGAPYFFAASPPIIGSSEPALIAAQAGNPTDIDQQATIYWQVYQWDSQLRENVVHEESRTIVIPAHETIPVSLTINDAKYPVYLAVGTLTWKDTRSIINVRFVRNGIDRTRLNFPSIVSYPLRAGVADTVFSCLNNTGVSDIVSGGRLELSVSDTDGNLIHSYTYSGDITGAMMGVADTFTPTRDYSSFVLDARLYDKNGFVDEAHLVYDCKDLDPDSCTSENGSDLVSRILNSSWESLIAIPVLLLILLVAIAYMYRRPSTLTTETSRL